MNYKILFYSLLIILVATLSYFYLVNNIKNNYEEGYKIGFSNATNLTTNYILTYNTQLQFPVYVDNNKTVKLLKCQQTNQTTQDVYNLECGLE